MAINKAAVSLFDDVTFYFDVVGNDDGNNYSYDPATNTFTSFPALSTLTQINIDKFAVKRNRTLVDHSTANSKNDWQRITKTSFTISIDTKLFISDTYLTDLITGSKIVFAGTDHASGVSFHGVGIVENFDINYGSPTTLAFTIRSYGAPLIWTALTQGNMKNRYRLKLTLPLTGTAASVLKFFPNALTFVAYLTEDQVNYQDYANLFLAPFKIQLDIQKVDK